MNGTLSFVFTPKFPTFLVCLVAVVSPAFAQVIYTETFTGADQVSGVSIVADQTWTVLGGVAALSGNAMVGGTEAYGIVDDGTNLDMVSTDTIVLEFDFTVTSFSPGEKTGLGVISLSDTGFPNATVGVNLGAASPPFELIVNDGSTMESATLGTPGAFVSGTTYHVHAELDPGASTACTVSITATAGAGGDVLVDAMTSVSLDLTGATGPFNPVVGGAENSATYSMDNVQISKVVAAAPASNPLGLVVIAVLIAAAAWFVNRKTLATHK